MVLLAGAGLFIRGLDELNRRRAGWESTHLATGTILLPAAKYADQEKIISFHRHALERLAAIPGVASASLASFTPFFDWDDVRKFAVEGRDRPEPGREPAAVVNAVSPDYFATVGTRILAGRAFDGRDAADSTPAYLVGESTARALFGTTDVIGRRLAPVDGGELRWGEIIGVVGDVRSVMAEPIKVPHQVYVPLAQEPHRMVEVAVRSSGAAPATLVDGIRREMSGLDPDLPVRDLRDADSRIRRNNYQLGVLRDMLTSFAVLGLGLASLGIYGIIARTMAQRTGEFAVRLALGARAEDLTRLVLVSGVKLAFVGSLIGFVGALGVGHLLAAGFPGLELNNSWALAVATLLLVAVALVASWLPARRATKVDPIAALRAE
jgi:predicted permease